MREDLFHTTEVGTVEEAIDELRDQPTGTMLTLINTMKSPEMVQADLTKAGIKTSVISHADPLAGRRGGSTVIYTVTVIE